ncbi:glycosyltransferase family 39 protein [Leptothoe sp. PORK10 BA2]|uniref:glycosyltransferase family 39 protein n=1 Tax=Leptothoe sp. PORK10 BA2 TaxID=3110254 RepID=UPI002B1F6E36|nr:glycosyltransferase family 39 protein [Leptothoe sp. PORK10 BA2]MEA5464208.1 glycosyltransferase family 39 protein [Leptothoe sp. PORK10 BA2]
MPSPWQLPGILALATLLRLWRLAAKPLWVDELYTAFYSQGKSLDVIPFNTLLPPADYWALLNNPGNPWQAAQAVTTHSNHPPLFFMAMNGWLHVGGTSVWNLRAFAVLWGVVAVAGVFYLGRRVGGPENGHRVGMVAALLMAVSPYGIYLSQEARHYSLAVAIALFALVNWIALLQGERSPQRWLSWIGLNTLGLYAHYFYSFSLIAQGLVTLISLLWRKPRRHQAIPWLLAMGAIALLYLPWLPTAITHFQSEGGTDWLNQPHPLWQTLLLPWLQSLAAALFMLILLPLEQMPLAVKITSGLVMLGVFGLVLSQMIRGWRREPLLDLGFPIVSYGLGVFGIILTITYGLGKDLTLAPRYFFMAYPAVTVVAALVLVRCRRWVVVVAIAAGILSQLFISYDLALLKPYLPGQVGRRLGADSSPTIVLIAPQQDNYRARFLSYVLAIPESKDNGKNNGKDNSRNNIQIAFTPPASPETWQPNLTNQEAISELISGSIPMDHLTLWIVEPKRLTPFPLTVTLANHTCSPMGERIKTEGTRQQKYQCSESQ